MKLHTKTRARPRNLSWFETQHKTNWPSADTTEWASQHVIEGTSSHRTCGVHVFESTLRKTNFVDDSQQMHHFPQRTLGYPSDSPWSIGISTLEISCIGSVVQDWANLSDRKRVSLRYRDDWKGSGLGGRGNGAFVYKTLHIQHGIALRPRI